MLTEEQTLLRDSAREWTRANAPVEALRRLRDEGSGRSFDPATWAGMAELGWAGVLAPEAHGGSQFGLAGLALVLEETGRNLVASPLLSTALIGVEALTRGGSPAQQAAWLPRLAAGEATAALALEEGPRHDPAAVALAVRREGDGYGLDGAKTFVLDGMEADLLIVAARTAGAPGEEAGITLFLVEADAPGVSRSRLALIDSRGAAQVRFDGVRLSADAVLGEVDAGFPLLEQVLDRARIGLAAEMLGQATEAFERTLDYLKQRTQFGQLIGGFQALQHRAAQMFSALELARSAVEAAVAAADAGDADLRAPASLAKALAGETLHRISNEMVQMHGGIGMTDAHDAGLHLKRARVAEAAFGGQAHHRDRYARLHGF